ncbi:MAG: glycosyltransferase family 4 protein [Thermoplasmatota archaeon]
MTPYYEPEGGGLERYAHALNWRLAARGHAVSAIACTKGERTANWRDGVPVERFPPTLFLGRAPIDRKFGERVGRAIKNFGPDVVFAHSPVPFPAERAYQAAKRARVPFVLAYHAGRLRGSRPLLGVLAALDRATFERRMIQGASRVIAVSPYVRDNALATAHGGVTVIMPGVDADRFAPSPPSGHDVLFVAPLARAYRWKGLDVLLDAMVRVRAAIPDAHLTLVGGGDRFAEIERRVDPAAVRLAGSVSDADLPAFYRRAAVVVLPSTTDAESFGMVLGEANASARPVVASRIGGIPDFVRDGVNGLLADPGDPVDLAAKLVDVLSNPERAATMGRRGREIVVREHDWADRARAAERVLADAAGVSLLPPIDSIREERTAGRTQIEPRGQS